MLEIYYILYHKRRQVKNKKPLLIKCKQGQKIYFTAEFIDSTISSCSQGSSTSKRPKCP